MRGDEVFSDELLELQQRGRFGCAESTLRTRAVPPPRTRVLTPERTDLHCLRNGYLVTIRLDQAMGKPAGEPWHEHRIGPDP